MWSVSGSNPVPHFPYLLTEAGWNHSYTTLRVEHVAFNQTSPLFLSSSRDLHRSPPYDELHYRTFIFPRVANGTGVFSRTSTVVTLTNFSDFDVVVFTSTSLSRILTNFSSKADCQKLCFSRLTGYQDRGGLVVRSRLWGRRVPGSKPHSTEDPPCIRNLIHHAKSGSYLSVLACTTEIAASSRNARVPLCNLLLLDGFENLSVSPEANPFLYSIEPCSGN
ncbi:hypothetical protein AVEN_235496-1 [Araneus ventricosus]|uniref:Uncharacterized protein n=1 Tax=Araneus ventricosus TaxID=182803 RepID=A0A4Y2A5F5_ARAVE|nr:hypothetical protein AVEN_235496-1 [Araneus ventricosus]